MTDTTQAIKKAGLQISGKFLLSPSGGLTRIIAFDRCNNAGERVASMTLQVSDDGVTQFAHGRNGGNILHDHAVNLSLGEHPYFGSHLAYVHEQRPGDPATPPAVIAKTRADWIVKLDKDVVEPIAGITVIHGDKGEFETLCFPRPIPKGEREHAQKPDARIGFLTDLGAMTSAITMALHGDLSGREASQDTITQIPGGFYGTEDVHRGQQMHHDYQRCRLPEDVEVASPAMLRFIEEQAEMTTLSIWGQAANALIRAARQEDAFTLRGLF